MLHELAGSHILGSAARAAFILEAGSNDTDDNRVVFSCAKNNDGEMPSRSAWHRCNGLFLPCPDFDWKAFDGPEDKRRTVTEDDLRNLFHDEDGRQRRIAKKNAADELEERTKLKRTACYDALSLTGRFKDHLREEGGLLSWLD